MAKYHANSNICKVLQRGPLADTFYWVSNNSVKHIQFICLLLEDEYFTHMILILGNVFQVKYTRNTKHIAETCL